MKSALDKLVIIPFGQVARLAVQAVLDAFPQLRESSMSNDEPMEQDFWEDTFAAKKLNGIYSNRIYAQPLGDGMVRINFGEILDDEPRYHTAIVATAAQVKAFAQLMFNVSQAVLEAEMAAIKESNLSLSDVVHAYLATPKTDTTAAKPPVSQKPVR